MSAIIPLVLKVSIALLVLATGLRASPGDVLGLWRRPGALARALLAMYVLVPLAALALVRVFHPKPEVGGAMLVLAISAGAPLLSKKLMKFDRESYVLGLSITTSLLAIVAVPAWVGILAPLFGSEAAVAPGEVARVLAKGFLAPMLAGMLLRPLLRGAAAPTSAWILKLAGAALAIVGLVLIVTQFGVIASVGWGSLVAFAVLTIVALAIGHVVGGPDPGERTALAVTCASRHIGIALLTASASPGKTALALVLAYLVGAMVITVPYLKWRGGGQA